MIIGGFQPISMIDYPGEICSIIFTRGCNFNCSYCHNKKLIKNNCLGNRLDENKILSRLAQRKKMVGATVISGGEPTLQKDLIDFMQKIKKINLKIKLDTNGSKPDILAEIIKLNLVDYVAMDIKAPLNKYNKITRSNIDVNNIKKSISLLINSPVKYEFRTTIGKHFLSPDDLNEIGQAINGASLHYLQQYHQPPTQKNISLKKIVDYSLDELNYIGQKIKPYVATVLVR